MLRMSQPFSKALEAPWVPFGREDLQHGREGTRRMAEQGNVYPKESLFGFGSVEQGQFPSP